MHSFEDKTAIVTGGASGIGRALCQELARRGARVIAADLNRELLDETIRGIKSGGGDAEGRVLDVTDHQGVREIVEEVAERHGRLDFMFNNAGIGVMGEALDYSYQDWKKVIDTNLYGVVNGVAAAYPVMARQGSGHVVNTASLAGLIPVPGLASYTASKYGVVGLSNSLRMEGAAYGVKVSVVCPGLIRTPLYNTIAMLNLDRDKVLEDAPRGMPPDRCVEVILRGVERNRAIILVTAGTWILWPLQRISPALMRCMIDLVFVRGFRRRRTSA
ncbi:MAG: SDR family oxidoreductase [Actinomycetota bacterium]|nr:SDR family oxidoreductase [Actinomycetota bacterium]